MPFRLISSWSLIALSNSCEVVGATKASSLTAITTLLAWFLGANISLPRRLLYQGGKMTNLDENELPGDPRNAGWTRADEPDGPVWVDRQGDGWNVWDPSGGYRSVDADQFEADYELEIGPTTLDVSNPNDPAG